MKNEARETAKQVQITEENYSTESLEFGEIVVYNEMADRTSVKINLIEQIHAQLNQIDELTHKRQFMMKEVMHYILD